MEPNRNHARCSITPHVRESRRNCGAQELLHHRIVQQRQVSMFRCHVPPLHCSGAHRAPLQYTDRAGSLSLGKGTEAASRSSASDTRPVKRLTRKDRRRTEMKSGHPKLSFIVSSMLTVALTLSPVMA